MVGVALLDGNLVVAIGFGREGDGNLTVSPTEAVQLETNSAPHMVLYPLANHDPRIPKEDVSVKKQFKAKPVTLKTGDSTAGYLFFANDKDASQVTVVVVLGDETFRFPFARNRNALAKFMAADAPSAPALEAGVAKTSALLAPSHTEQSSGGTMGCAKNISFAVADGGQVTTVVPDFAAKWIKGNQKKYPSTCFSQTPIGQADNYVLVIAYSASAYNGIFPTVRTSTNTSTTPVSGSGTVTSNYGDMWNYTYDGTVTTTTTTTEHLNVPYTDESRTMYMYTYDQRGTLRSRHWRTVTTRNGGDAYNTLGYNLAALLTSIHVKEHLLGDSVKDVVGGR
jgi:hypothetical protein